MERRLYNVTINHAEEGEKTYQTLGLDPADAICNTDHGYWIRGYTWRKKGKIQYAYDHLTGAFITARANPTRKRQAVNHAHTSVTLR